MYLRRDGRARGLVAVHYASAAAVAPPPRPCFLHPATPPVGSSAYRRNEGLNLSIARSTKGKGFRAHTWLADADDSGTFKGEATEDGIAFTRPDGPQLCCTRATAKPLG